MPSHPAPRMDTEDDVLGGRIVAFLVDEVVAIVAAVVTGVSLALLLQSESGVWLGVLPTYFGYFIVTEGVWGQTIGKRVFGLVVVTERGQSITMGQSAARNVLRFIDGFASYAVGLVAMLLSDRNQRIGDRVAATVVVRAA